MEIPGALHTLQAQYENVIARFNFGRYDPIQQAAAFRKKATEFLSIDLTSSSKENIVLLAQKASFDQIEYTKEFISTLWQTLTS